MSAERVQPPKRTSSNNSHPADTTLAPSLSTGNSNGAAIAARSSSLYGGDAAAASGGVPVHEQNLSNTSLNTKGQAASTGLPPITVMGSNSGGSSSSSQPVTPRSTHYELLRELVHKRIATFIYFKRLYEGRSFYLNTMHITSELLQSSSAHGTDDAASGKSRFDIADLDTSEYTRLELQPVPFELDYTQTLYSLCDIMGEVYGKLLDSSCDQTFWELVLKLDARLKAIIIHLSKLLDGVARHAVKEEFAAIDPLLANVDSIISTDDYANSNSHHNNNDASSIYSL
ncbi:hypothetical protein SYNPS1DRAFT_19709 [Syncephalis pseudoplumigaleata]|uniref:Uncharacterized protein n=1 Tax=Syncephalis pseudoplumigaleata TaxID=1712513 RepID=A0A4P9YSF1_9FUNG|nr:hypothetical protein SYNPS1DRAFT_19709 [Syncephalis pseudoplumigaleata]|eukprot:RKP22694.1 hypothetical protein SYNPS1DRAFT_19709 [Syncephalis pseudoplumigaleata]